MATLWLWYLRHLSRRPLLTQAWSTGVISGLGDAIAQQMVETRSLREHDWKRTFRFSTIGLVVVGPVLGRWFTQLDKVVGTSLTAKVALKKMLLDQFCFAPVFFAILLPILWLSQGLPPAQLPDKLTHEYPTILIANYKVWPIVQTLNFCFVPLHFRVNVANTVAVGWNTYLSWRTHRYMSQGSKTN